MVEVAQQVLTDSEFASEPAAWEHFDACLARAARWFDVYHEVEGEIIQPRVNTGSGGVRIDRLVIPRPVVIDAGWTHGPFGVEGKKSGTKVGPVISQAIDYSRSVFKLETGRLPSGEFVRHRAGFCVTLEWIFIYPLDKAGGDIDSIMAQQRIGWVRTTPRGALVFGCGGTNGIVLAEDGTVTDAKELPMGRKRGSR